MYIRPSKIHYCHRDPEINNSTKRTFGVMSKGIQGNSVFPKLQVVKKDGLYFTLNDAKLQLYRHLEKLGNCGSVEVERVPLKEVPEGIRRLMKAPDSVPCLKRYRSKNTHHARTCLSSRTMHFTSVKNEDSDESEASDSDFSDVDFSDWSDEEITETDTATSNGTQKKEAKTNCDESESFV